MGPRDGAPTPAASRRPRLLVLTQVYRPEPNFITADVAEHLSADMHVTVVTAHPNYPLGRFYANTRWWWPTRSVERGGVVVWRLPIYPYHGRSAIKRAACYLTFAIGAALWAPWVAPRPSLVWVYHGPFTVGLAALWFRLATRARFIYTCADLWPECFLAAEVARPGLLMRMMFRYSRAINRLAHTLVCSTRGTLQRYLDDGVPAAALHYVPVWVEGVPSADDLHSDFPANESRTIVYAGNLGPAQCLETLVIGAAALENEGMDVQVVIYGTGNSEQSLHALAAKVGAHNVTFRGRVSPAQAFEASEAALAQVASLQPSPLFAMTIPSKLSHCFAAGSPVLYGLPGEAARLVAESGGGIAYDPLAPSSLVAAVKQLLRQPREERLAMRQRLRAYYRKHFDRKPLLERYRDLFLDALAARDRPGVVPREEETAGLL